MKTKLALALSTLGVLSAGSAAALVNTDLLDRGPAVSGVSAAILPPPVTVDLTIPTLPSTAAGTASTSTTPTSAASTPRSSSSVPTTSSSVPTTATTLPGATPTSSTDAPPSGPTGMLTTYNVGTAGSVTVDLINGRLVFVRAEANAGWTVTESEVDDDGDEVEVDFRSGDAKVEFTARYRNGAIVTDVEAQTATSTTAPANTTVTTIDDHDDDGHDDDDDRSGSGHDDDSSGSDDDRDSDDDSSGSDDDSSGSSGSGRDHDEDD